MSPKKKPLTKEKSVTKTEKSKTKTEKTKTEKSKRPPTAYQIFMKEEIARLKDSHPKLEHKERFSMAAQNWSKQKK